MSITKILLCICISCSSLAQVKNEYEKRIAVDQFPKNAVVFLDMAIDNFQRIRFYEEFDGQHHSFECKFIFNRKRYSVEFDSLGNLEDIEIKIRKRALDTETYKAIKNNLNQRYSRWKFEKIQWQFPVNENPAATLADALALKPDASNNYEIIVATKHDGKLQEYEMLFASNGTFIEQRKVSRRSYDFILF